MKLPNWFKILWWVAILLIVTVFLYHRYPDLIKGNATSADIFISLIWVGLVLLPLFEELSFFGITFKKEVEKLKSDITTQFDTLKADIKNTINFQVLMPASGQISPQKESTPPKRNSMEYKILNTLWTKQVNKFPNFSPLFTFVISSNSPEYLQFREAGGKLIGERLVGETDTGHYHLTDNGWHWCKEHYSEFPSDQWWPEEPILKEKLEEVVKNA